MTAEEITNLIGTLGFPIVCVIALAWFLFYVYKKSTEANREQIQQIQADSKEREAKLYEEIKANRETNAKAIETITLYAEKLDVIQTDVESIKTDMTKLTAKN